MDPTDSALLKELEGGLPLVSEPFDEVGRRLGITGEEVLGRLHRLQAEGFVRKIRARINQRRLGITANALVAWRVPDDQDRGVYALLASLPGVSHCYQRRPIPGRWEYAAYTVHHGRNREEVRADIAAAAEIAGIGDYVVLFSTEEFKRVPAGRISEIGGDLR